MDLCMLRMRTEMDMENMKCPICLSSFKHTVSLQVAGSIKILSAIFELGYIRTWIKKFQDWFQIPPTGGST
jgi:hypothetical protein